MFADQIIETHQLSFHWNFRTLESKDITKEKEIITKPAHYYRCSRSISLSPSLISGDKTLQMIQPNKWPEFPVKYVHSPVALCLERN